MASSKTLALLRTTVGYALLGCGVLGAIGSGVLWAITYRYIFDWTYVTSCDRSPQAIYGIHGYQGRIDFSRNWRFNATKVAWVHDSAGRMALGRYEGFQFYLSSAPVPTHPGDHWSYLDVGDEGFGERVLGFVFDHHQYEIEGEPGMNELHGLKAPCSFLLLFSLVTLACGLAFMGWIGRRSTGVAVGIQAPESS